MTNTKTPDVGLPAQAGKQDRDEELQLIKDNRVLMPKMYSFDEVRELLTQQEEELREQERKIRLYGKDTDAYPENFIGVTELKAKIREELRKQFADEALEEATLPPTESWEEKWDKQAYHCDFCRDEAKEDGKI